NEVLENLQRLEFLIAQNSRQNGEYLRTYNELVQRFELMGGWSRRAQALKILVGLGFEEKDFERPVETFSAGWQMRVQLARILMESPSFLVLDEPTNHLDIESIAWFETYLDAFPGAILIVSHDRVFLDYILNATQGQKGILEVGNGRVNLFRTDFSGYLKEKEDRQEHLIKAAREQARKISDIKKFIDRFHAYKDKATLVRSRKRILEKMEIIKVEHERRKIDVRFPCAPIESRRILTLKQISQKYNGRVIFADIDLYIDRGEKIALIGKNGAGKSTLCRIIAGLESPASGSRSVSEKLIISSFFQEGIRDMDPEITVYDWAYNEAPEEVRAQIRNFLGMFLFSGDDVFKRIGVLSGGEKTRLLILAAMVKYSNFLILDEPTFHLDRDSIEALMRAVLAYPGAVLMVTHDRDLVGGFAKRILELSNGRLYNYPGDYQHYLWKKGVTPTEQEGNILGDPQNQTRKDAGEEIESKIQGLKAKLNRIDEKIKNPNLFNDPKKIKQLMDERERLNRLIDSFGVRLDIEESKQGDFD
ncbi:MAG: ABC-F family ATP-binding cassette domain-containing protein, partial [candidate division WOR-3 bacterium]